MDTRISSMLFFTSVKCFYIELWTTTTSTDLNLIWKTQVSYNEQTPVLSQRASCKSIIVKYYKCTGTTKPDQVSVTGFCSVLKKIENDVVILNFLKD